MNNYLFNGKLINQVQSWEWIKRSLISMDQDGILISAYIKKSILEEIVGHIGNKKIKILARWNLMDLVGGASDIDCYQIALDNGWDFYIDMHLHAKIYSLPPNGILLGSANATNAGLGFSSSSNHEAGTVVEADQENLNFIENMFRQAVKLDDKLFSKIKDAYEACDRKKQIVEWPNDLLDEITPKVFKNSDLLIDECLHSNGSGILNEGVAKDEDSLHDLSLLGIPLNVFDREFIVSKFLHSKIFLFTLSVLKDNNGTISYGTLTAALHNALVEDPKPYRSEIKEKFINSIYSWIRLVGPELTNIRYERPNHSELLKFVG